MAAVLKADDVVVRDNGVVLRYPDPGTLRPHHVENRLHPSDRECMDLIAAERSWRTLAIICEHGGYSDLGLRRISYALENIRRALNIRRRELGMHQADDQSPEGLE